MNTAIKSFSRYLDSFGLKSKPEALSNLKFRINDLFETQKNADQARRILGKEFKNAVGLYFKTFIQDDKLDCHGLEKAIAKHDKVLKRHLKPADLIYLKLIIDLMKEHSAPRRGLLEVA